MEPRSGAMGMGDGRGGRPAPARLSALLLALGTAVAGAAVPEQPGAGAPAAEAPASRAAIAMLPVQNRSDAAAPLAEIRRTLATKLAGAGLFVLDEASLEAFMRRHRMRYVGGINRELAQALREETGVGAVLVTSLDLFREANPPKAALTARLVSAGPEPRILWMDSAAESGDAAPGFLDLGLVTDIAVILDRVTDRIVASASRPPGPVDAGDRDGEGQKPQRRFLPKVSYSLPGVAVLGGGNSRIAVVPLANETAMPYAGDIVTDQLVCQLVNSGSDVLEPGVVRQALLETRLIQPEGPSIPQADVLQEALDADRILFGTVAEYREAGGGTLDPLVDFSVRALDTGTRQVIWSSISHTRGDERVFWFDAGRIATAHELASRMTGAVVAMFRRPAVLSGGGG